MAHTVGSPPPQPTLSDLLRIEQEQQQHGSAYTLAAGSSTNVASEKQYLVSVTMVVFVSTLLAGVLIMRHGERIRVIALGLRSLNASSPATKPVDARTSRRRRPAGSRPIGSRAPERDSDLEAPQELETETEDDDEYPPPSSRSEGVVPSSATRSRPLPPKTSNARHDRSSQQQKQQQEEQRQGQQRRQRQQQQHQQQPARGALSRSRSPQDVNRVPTASCRSGRTQGARSLQPHVIQHARFAPPDRCSGGRSAGGHECAKDLHGVFWQTPIAAVSVYAYAEEVTEGTAPCTKPLRKPQPPYTRKRPRPPGYQLHFPPRPMPAFIAAVPPSHHLEPEESDDDEALPSWDEGRNEAHRREPAPRAPPTPTHRGREHQQHAPPQAGRSSGPATSPWQAWEAAQPWTHGACYDSCNHSGYHNDQHTAQQSIQRSAPSWARSSHTHLGDEDMQPRSDTFRLHNAYLDEFL